MKLWRKILMLSAGLSLFWLSSFQLYDAIRDAFSGSTITTNAFNKISNDGEKCPISAIANYDYDKDIPSIAGRTQQQAP